MYPFGSLAWMKGAWQTGLLLPLSCEVTGVELIRVLSYTRFGISEDDQQALLDDYLPWCEEVQIPPALDVPYPHDPNDCQFLALAGNADALVTGDNELLSLAGEFSTPIITPRQLRERLTAGN